MSGSQSFSWLGTVSSDWNTAANWFDITTSQAGVVVPGALDAVAINSGTITGSGSAASIAFTGWNTINAAISASTITVVGATESETVRKTLMILGGTLSSDTLLDEGTMAVIGGTVQVANALTVGAAGMPGVLSVATLGFLQAGNVVLGQGSRFGAEYQQNLGTQSDAALGTIGIGSSGSAQAGALTIDPGHTISGSGTISGTIINNGLILATGSMTVGDPYQAEIFAAGTHYTMTAPEGLLSGTGTIEVQTGASLTVAGTVSGQIVVDTDANLVIEGDLSAGATITLAPPSNVALSVARPTVTGSHTLWIDDKLHLGGSASLPSISAHIAGFTFRDVIAVRRDLVNGVDVTSVSYANGVLSLLNGGTVVEALAIGSGVSTVAPVVRPSLTDPAVLLIGFTQSYHWTGSGGSWNQRANWYNVTTSIYAAAVPGELDTVLIDNGQPGPTTGGHAARVDLLSGSTELQGPLLTGSLLLGGTVSSATLTIDNDVSVFATDVTVAGETSAFIPTGGHLSVGTAGGSQSGPALLSVSGALSLGAPLGRNELSVYGTVVAGAVDLGPQVVDGTLNPGSAVSRGAAGSIVVAQHALIIPCFAAGTRIATPGGMMPVERLRTGDAVLTLSGTIQSIQWIGRRTLNCRLHR